MAKGKVIFSHPTGNFNAASVVNALYDADLLAAYYTCVVWRAESPWAKLVPGSVRSVLERRMKAHVPTALTYTRPLREIVRNLLIRGGKKHLIASEDSPLSIDAVYRDLDQYVARSLSRFPEARAVYAYDDGALHQFREARKRGIRCVYDLPIGYWRANKQLSVEEAQLQPAWKDTLNVLLDSDEKCARKDEEIELADTVIVPSRFVEDTLAMFPGGKKKIVINPFGVPSTIAPARTGTDPNQPLRVLYVGSLTQRKGISYLFEAADLAGSAVQLTVIGRKVGNSTILNSYCEKYRWIPSLSHSAVLEEMQRNDVFVFPSLFEGFGLVVGEAFSQGLPVISSPNPGGIEVIRDGIDGFVVPFRDAEAIAARLLQLHANRDLQLQMSNAARERASQLTWGAYEERAVKAIREALV